MVGQYLFLFNILYYFQISLIYSKFLKKELCFSKKTEMEVGNLYWKIKFQQRRAELKCSIYKRTNNSSILCHFLQQNIIIGTYF